MGALHKFAKVSYNTFEGVVLFVEAIVDWQTCRYPPVTLLGILDIASRIAHNDIEYG